LLQCQLNFLSRFVKIRKKGNFIKELYNKLEWIGEFQDVRVIQKNINLYSTVYNAGETILIPVLFILI